MISSEIQTRTQQTETPLRYETRDEGTPFVWAGPLHDLTFDEVGMQRCLLNLAAPCHLVQYGQQLALTNSGQLRPGSEEEATSQAIIHRLTVPTLPLDSLGSAAFRQTYGVRYAYMSGAMANGIASVELVTAMGRAGLLGSFGAAGLVPSRLEAAIRDLQANLPNGPYAFNLIHSPSEAAIEMEAVALYRRYGVHTVEASAFLDLTPAIVAYRVGGLHRTSDGQIDIANRVIAKISRQETAAKFMQPAPANLLRQLVERGDITAQQAELAAHVPMADDITVEADSGGHTDNRPLVALLPTIMALRDEIQARYNYTRPLRVGAAGGIGTPAAALAAFAMGADYIVTGSVNQACVEAGASAHTRQLLAQADLTDVAMAPAADMFELGVKLQVLKRGTFFPMRAQKLYDLYQRYPAIEAIPADERQKIEKQIFRRSLDAVWEDTAAYFEQRDPAQLERATNNPRRKMALIFRWYLGLSSRWSNIGEAGRETDYQIWCGPAMGAFNQWVADSYLAEPKARRVVDVAEHLMRGAAYLQRLHSLRLGGLHLPTRFHHYQPRPLS